MTQENDDLPPICLAAGSWEQARNIMRQNGYPRGCKIKYVQRESDLADVAGGVIYFFGTYWQNRRAPDIEAVARAKGMEVRHEEPPPFGDGG